MRVESFDTLEEAQAAMAAAEEAANAQVTKQQTKIGMGDCWMRPLGPDYDYAMVFGRVSTLTQVLASELLGVTEFDEPKARTVALVEAGEILARMGVTNEQAFDRSALEFVAAARQVDLDVGPEDVGQWESVWASTIDSYARGYRFGWAWSVMDAAGEIGTTHVSEMIPLRESELDDARDANWDFAALANPKSPTHCPWATMLVLEGGAKAFARDLRAT